MQKRTKCFLRFLPSDRGSCFSFVVGEGREIVKNYEIKYVFVRSENSMILRECI